MLTGAPKNILISDLSLHYNKEQTMTINESFVKADKNSPCNDRTEMTLSESRAVWRATTEPEAESRNLFKRRVSPQCQATRETAQCNICTLGKLCQK